VTAITYPNFPANNVTYTYGAAAQRSPSLVGNVVGRITHITDGAGTEDRLYGPLGEIVKETRAGSSPGSTFLGLIGEAMFADRMTRDTRDPRFGGIISQSMVVTTPTFPGELLRNAVGYEIPDLYLVQGHLSDQRIVWGWM
jgi:hypothetical protein